VMKMLSVPVVTDLNRWMKFSSLTVLKHLSIAGKSVLHLVEALLINSKAILIAVLFLCFLFVTYYSALV